MMHGMVSCERTQCLKKIQLFTLPMPSKTNRIVALSDLQLFFCSFHKMPMINDHDRSEKVFLG